MARVAELIWKGDNRSAIRALKGIADQSEKTAATTRHSADETISAYERVGGATIRLRERVSGLAGMVGFGGLAFGLKDAIQGGMQLQAAQAQLRMALGGSKTAFEQLNVVAERASTHGGFGTPQNLQSLTAFIRETHSASEATKLFGLATDIARGRNMDLSSAQSVVARAYTGSVGRLQQLLGPMVAAKEATFGLTQAHKEQIAQLELESRSYGKLGPQWLHQQEIIDGITPKMQALATLQDKSATARQVLAAAQTAFGGSAAAFSQTTAGKLSNLQHAAQNTTDTLGTKLMPIVNRLAGILLGVVNVFSKLPGPLQTAILGFGAFAAMVPFIKNAGTAINYLGKMAGITAGKEVLLGDASEGAAAKEGVASTVGAGAAGAAGAEATVAAEAAGGASLLSRAGRVARGVGRLILPAYLGYQAFKALSPSDQYNPSPVMMHGHAFYRAHGGVVPRYMADGGPMGSDTVPAWLTPGEGVLSLRGMQALGELNAGHAGAQEITIRVPVRLDSRVLTEAVARYSLNRGARGPTSLVGGSLVTGSPGFG